MAYYSLRSIPGNRKNMSEKKLPIHQNANTIFSSTFQNVLVIWKLFQNKKI